MVTQEQLREQITAQVIAALGIRQRAALATTVAARQECRGSRQRGQQAWLPWVEPAAA